MGKNLKEHLGVVKLSSCEEDFLSNELNALYSNAPLPIEERLQNLGLFSTRQLLSRILFMHELYNKIINVHGNIFEFGVRWGQNLSLFHAFRGIYEPFNHNRKIVGFDTFSGFPIIDKRDGVSVNQGDYSVAENYEEYLELVLTNHEKESPISHIKKFELVKGDASITVPKYLESHPETIIAFAYFDFDIYKPTVDCLKAILRHLVRGSLIAFDELNYSKFPGETLAVMEVLGLNNIRLQRSPLSPLGSYFIFEGNVNNGI